MAKTRLVPLKCPDCSAMGNVWVKDGEKIEPKDLICACGTTMDRGQLLGTPLTFVALKDRLTPQYRRNYDSRKFREPKVGNWGEKMIEHPEFKNEGMFG